MHSWRPRKISDLFNPGYQDRFNYYTQLFALFIAFVGTIGVVLSMVQTAYTVKAANDDSVKMAIQKVVSALERIESSLNVGSGVSAVVTNLH